MMRKIFLILFVLMFVATASWAVTIGPNGSYLKGSVGDYYYDTGAESGLLTDTSGVNDDATAFIFLEIAGFKDQNTFGIYDFSVSGGVVSLGETLEIFSGPMGVGADVTLRFDLAAGTVQNSLTGVFANIGKNFGFYITTPQNNGYTYYSHTSLNIDGKDHFKIFDTSLAATGFLGSDIVLAIEDLYNLGDNSFDDMVIGMTDVMPVPEPGTLLLLGSGLAALALYRRRSMNK